MKIDACSLSWRSPTWRYTGNYTNVPTNTVQVPINTGTVTDSDSVYTMVHAGQLGHEL